MRIAAHAEEIVQAVFVIFARKAASLRADTVLEGWLHETTRLTALSFLRGERRRQFREQASYMQSTLPESTDASIWNQLAPLLDEALSQLGKKDRDAVMLRFFKERSLAEVSAALNITEAAAQSRVHRAVEKLRRFFTKRGVVLPAAVLTAAISANSVQAAPAVLAKAAIAVALAKGATASVSTLTLIKGALKTMAWTKAKTAIVSAVIVGMSTVSVIQRQAQEKLREQNQMLREQQTLLAKQIEQLQTERGDEASRLVALTDELARVKRNSSEVLKLRGEVGVLREEKATANDQSAISKITADPETLKALREQQKTSLGNAYADLAKRLKLTPEQTAQLNDLLADHSMRSIDLITQSLRDHKSQTEVRRIFSTAEMALQRKVQALFGDDALAQYQDYTRNLGTTMFVESFADTLTGDPATVADKKNWLSQAMREETQSALADAGLPADFQTLVVFNHANYASEEEAALSLHLKDGIFGRVAARAGTFLGTDELNKFQESRTNAIRYSQNFLLMNRRLMSPGSP